jgi:hypothetical protein
MKKMMMDVGPTAVSTRAVLRARRWDLSINTPKDDAAYSQVVGNARFLRILEVRVKPGHASHFEELVKQAKMAYENDGSNWSFFVSQAVAGEPGGTYYISTLQPSMAGFDSAPNLRKLMGDDAFMKWEKESADAVEFSITTIYRFLPELSNPAKEVADVAPDFWHPKMMSMSRPKPKPAETGKAPQQ